MWVSKSRLTVVTAVVILPANSDKMVANDGTYTRSLIYHWSIYFPGNCNLRSLLVPCGNVEAVHFVGTACDQAPFLQE
jgi:hypothetical protein